MRLPLGPVLAQDAKRPVMKSINGIGLLNLVREHGPTSRASLATLSGLSKPTVSSQIESLIRDGLVVEHGPGKAGARGGKIPTLVQFNADAGRLIAVAIDSAELRFACTDLEGNVRHSVTKPFDPREGGNRMLGTIRRVTASLVAQDDSKARKIRLIAVAAPGRVDAGRGVVLEAGGVFNWRAIAVRDRLEQSFGFPAFVDNDVNMAALAELHYGLAKGVQNFVLVRLDTGLGCGVVIGGSLYQGSGWAAGEIAHMLLDLKQAGCDWRSRGYLESVLGADRVAARVQTATRRSGLLRSLAANNEMISALSQAAQQGDAQAKYIWSDLIRHLGSAIANVVVAYDPGMVVLQGELFARSIDEVRKIVGMAIPWKPDIRLSALGPEAVLLGTIAAARSHAYERLSAMLNRLAVSQPSTSGITPNGRPAGSQHRPSAALVEN
jgi:predicted NBD/HSP70 family sugar kinase